MRKVQNLWQLRDINALLANSLNFVTINQRADIVISPGPRVQHLLRGGENSLFDFLAKMFLQSVN